MSDLAGTRILLRLAARRDRLRLPLWVAAIGGFAGYCLTALGIAYPTPQDLGAIVSFVQGPAGTLLSGPGYGLDPPTDASVFAAVYGLYVMIAAAFMNVLLVVRHTRGDEESGRTELLRAGVVGRHATLVAAMVLAMLADAALVVLVTAVLAGPLGLPGAALFAAGVGVVGLAFAGIAAVAVQVSESTSATTGLTVVAIGLAVVVRGVGDVIEDNGSALSWLSPFAWAQQTRVFVDGRWWPLVPCLVVGVVGLALGLLLQGRRDVGSGLVSARPGPARGGRRLASAWSLALRLARSSIAGWAVAVGVVGVLYGSLAQSVQTSFSDLPDDLLVVLGGDRSQLLDGFVSVMILFDATLAACCGVAVVRRLAVEEDSGRAGDVLATAVGRARWMAAGVGVALVGALAVLVAAGLGMGVATAAVLGDGSRVSQVLLAHLSYLPAVAVVVAVASLGFAVRPGLVGAAWVVVGFCAFVGFFGPVVGLPGAVEDVSPFAHAARMPLESFSPGPPLVLAAIAAGVTAAALALFDRRDLTAG